MVHTERKNEHFWRENDQVVEQAPCLFPTTSLRLLLEGCSVFTQTLLVQEVNWVWSSIYRKRSPPLPQTYQKTNKQRIYVVELCSARSLSKQMTQKVLGKFVDNIVHFGKKITMKGEITLVKLCSYLVVLLTLASRGFWRKSVGGFCFFYRQYFICSILCSELFRYILLLLRVIRLGRTSFV